MLRRTLTTILAILMLTVGIAFAEEAVIPESFTFSGGSGRIQIDCPRVWWEEGVTMAELVFSSPNYVYVKVDGVEYPTTVEGGTSSTVVPVTPNRPMQILAMTTAMSAPHEIEYTIELLLNPGDA